MSVRVRVEPKQRVVEEYCIHIGDRDTITVSAEELAELYRVLDALTKNKAGPEKSLRGFKMFEKTDNDEWGWNPYDIVKPLEPDNTRVAPMTPDRTYNVHQTNNTSRFKWGAKNAD